MPVNRSSIVDRPREWWQHLYMRSPAVRVARKIPTFLKYHPPDDPYYLRIPGPHADQYTDANPFKIPRISPDAIRYCSHRPYVRWRNAGKVKAGDWDARTREFAEASFYAGIDASFYESLRAHFVDGVAWEDTPFIDEVLQRIETGASPWECSSIAEVRGRCAKMDRLYAETAEHGYKSQRELRATNGTDPTVPTDGGDLLDLVKRYSILGRDEIAVDIGRDGAFLFYDSKNRLAIAKLLGLKEVPVRVVVRHARWQATRDRVRRGELHGDEPLGHPDLQDLDHT